MIGRVLLASMLLTGTAMAARAQDNQNNRDDTLRKAGQIASQPARDVGIDKSEIPPVLQKASENPYAMPTPATCKNIAAQMASLTEAVGPDFTVGQQENENRTGKIVEAGGKTLVNALIPFRGLVREVSGAAPAQRRLEAAVSTGIARRGFLRGLGKAKGCRVG